MTTPDALEAFSTLAAMSGSGPVKLMLLAVGGCLALAGCGDDSNGGEIPEDTATALQQALERVEGAQPRDCTTAEDAAGDFTSRVEDLGDDVDESIRESLEEGASQVNDLVSREICVSTGPSPEITTETAPTTTETVPTTTETTEETTTATEPEEDGEEGEDGEDGEAPVPSDEGEAPPEQPPGEGGGEGFQPGGSEGQDSGGVGAEG
jgi:hypothetical protein